jgi:hypothetical protein
MDDSAIVTRAMTPALGGDSAFATRVTAPLQCAMVTMSCDRNGGDVGATATQQRGRDGNAINVTTTAQQQRDVGTMAVAMVEATAPRRRDGDAPATQP